MPLIPRMIFIIPTVLGVCFVTFLLMKAVPGDPVLGLVGEHADAQVIAAYREKLGLNEGLLQQWCRHMGLLLRGDMGVSYYTKIPVAESIADKFPNTLILASASLSLALLIGVLSGIAAALCKGGWLDKLVLGIVTLGMSLPVFWFALLLILIFSYWLHWLPAVGMGGWRHLALPALTLASRSCAGIARLVRSTLLDTLKEPYVAVARAKGLSKMRVVLAHAFRATWVPLVTMVGLDFAGYLNGSVLTETIFGWDGLGRYAMIAIFRRDYPVILGTVFFGALVTITTNLVVDSLYRFLDPTLRDEKNK